MTLDDDTPNDSLRRTVLIVAAANLGYFGVEFTVALSISSVSLFADSVDFLEDASVNLLIAIALAWSSLARARIGFALAALILVPGLATVWTAWVKFIQPIAPQALPLTLVGLGALSVNLVCAFLLARVRHVGGSLSQAAFLSARNDAAANLAIIGAGLTTAFIWASAWPDLIVGLAIAALNAGAAWEVWVAARKEQSSAQS